MGNKLPIEKLEKKELICYDPNQLKRFLSKFPNIIQKNEILNIVPEMSNYCFEDSVATPNTFGWDYCFKNLDFHLAYHYFGSDKNYVLFIFQKKKFQILLLLI